MAESAIFNHASRKFKGELARHRQAVIIELSIRAMVTVIVTTTEIANSLLHTHYGEAGMLMPLDGDEDENFLLESNTGKKYTFKLMHAGCTEAAVALPCAVLQHLEGLPINIPRVIPSLKKQPFESICLEGNKRFIWLLSWCPGTLLVKFSPHCDSVYESFGRALAEIDSALQSFSHPAMHIQSNWQLTSAMESAHKVDDIEGKTRDITRKIFDHFEKTVQAKLPSLPQGVIHNDANDYNVLVNIEGGEAVVDGLFDFGDSCWQPIICDVAIALAYLIHHKKDPLAVCARFLQGYNTVRPLSGPEIEVLLDLIRTRLAVTVAISSHRQKLEPDNQYIVFSQQPSKAALLALDQINHEFAESVFRQACGLLPVKSGKGVNKLR
jgi:Ser/Thr protein kinase RdoA (MazF antagonist)